LRALAPRSMAPLSVARATGFALENCWSWQRAAPATIACVHPPLRQPGQHVAVVGSPVEPGHVNIKVCRRPESCVRSSAPVTIHIGACFRSTDLWVVWVVSPARSPLRHSVSALVRRSSRPRAPQASRAK